MNNTAFGILECFVVLPFIVPLIVGSYLLYKYKSEHDRMLLMAGLLTLKPILTTPIWLLIASRTYNELQPQIAAFLGILPGASLTALTVLGFRSQFSGRHAGRAWTLLAFDSVRWINTFLYASTSMGVTAILGLALPTIYALLVTIVLGTYEIRADLNMARDGASDGYSTRTSDQPK